MHILNDFFLLNWDEEASLIEKDDDEFTKNIFDIYTQRYEHFCDSCSLILIVNSQNFDKISHIGEFKQLFNALFKDKLLDRNLIIKIQKIVLEFIQEIGNKDLNQTIKENFEILRKQGIITYYISRRLIGLIALVKEHKNKEFKIKLKTAKSDKNYYKNTINILETSIENLKQCVEETSYLAKLDEVNEKLKNERFSIGVTGVINSGKSTMLNALLQKDILGTSVVPETANLTILKYSKSKYAKVNFWSKKEFQEIQESSDEIECIKKFINQTKESFKTSLDDYIKDESRCDKIGLEELGSYTSVGKSSNKCNLVKSVELYSDLEFLREGVEIVDTPGLDDPIIQREKITLEYISQCDLMIHLMNVNQSATKKDIDFIIDSFTYQNIARLLIVITKVDTVSKGELYEAIKYTKKSIEERLKKQNRIYNLDMIIKNIEFIPLSAKMALRLRTNQEGLARKEGYDLAKSGILLVEEYLNRTLFGQNSQKANLIIQSNKGDILSIIMQAKKLFKQEKFLLGRSAVEVRQEYKKFKEARENILNSLISITDLIKEQKQLLVLYFEILHKYSYDLFSDLKDAIKIRVLDDVSYERRKNKTYPKQDRVEYIVESGFKDGLIDLIREYRYQFSRKMQNSFEIITKSFIAKHLDDLLEDDKFDSQEFFERYFKSLILFQNRSVELKKINELIKKYSKSSSENLHNELDKVLQDIVNNLIKVLNSKLEEIDKELIKFFMKTCDRRIDAIKEGIEAKDKILDKSMQRINTSAIDKLRRVHEIDIKVETLEKIEKDLGSLNESF